MEKLSVRIYIICPFLLFIAVAGCQPKAAPKNIIIVSLDTLRADRLGCYGYPIKTSPNIDGLAQKSVRFANTYAQSSWTLPSHMSFFTSLYPSFHKVLTKDHALSPDIKTLAEILRQNGYITAAFTEGGNMFRIYGFGRGFDIYAEKNKKIELTFNQAFEWLKQKKDKKFFLFIHTYEIHTPYLRTELADPAKRGRLPETLKVDDLLYDIMYGRFQLTEDEKDYIRGLYDSGVLYADKHIGKLLKLLADLGLKEKTTLLIFSDHGEDLWEHGVSPAHGLTLYQDQLLVPAILYDPAFPDAKTVEHPVELIDFMPTLLALNGIKIPADLQGSNLLPAIKTDAGFRERPIFSEGTDYGPNRIAIIKDGYKYVYLPEPEKVKRDLTIEQLAKLEKNLSTRSLFALNSDPLETKNIYKDNIKKAGDLHRVMVDTYINKSRAIPEVSLKEGLVFDQLERLRSLGYIQ